jgi:hypothetical protein
MRNNLIARGASHVPGLRRLPVFKLLALAEIAILARQHVYHLNPQERHRLIQLVQTSRGRKGNLSAAERKELADLLGKMEPRLFAGAAADMLSPVPLPKRFTQGPRRVRKEREERQERERERSTPSS